MTQQERNEHLTNWYMINLAWGALGIILLYALSQCYRYATFLSIAQPVMWSVAAIFALGAIVLFVLGKVKASSRMVHYGEFFIVCAVVGVWFALFNSIRPLLENLLQTITKNASLIVSSYWIAWIPMIAIGVYLVLAFVWYVIQLAKK